MYIYYNDHYGHFVATTGNDFAKVFDFNVNELSDNSHVPTTGDVVQFKDGLWVKTGKGFKMKFSTSDMITIHPLDALTLIHRHTQYSQSYVQQNKIDVLLPDGCKLAYSSLGWVVYGYSNNVIEKYQKMTIN